MSYYWLAGPDNDGYWTPDLKDERWCCPVCGAKLLRSFENPEFYLKKKNYDFSSTYDGFTIVSEDFLNVVAEVVDSLSLIFLKPNRRYTKTYARLEALHVARLDFANAMPEVGAACAACGQPEHIVAAHDYFTLDKIKPEGLYRTDAEFGSGFGRGPILIVGEALADRLKHARLKGLNLTKVAATPQSGGRT